jgi:tRNA U34 5-methylaminomethyl-2-thiouridine-forming methyltransferase MnmC
MIIKPTKDGSHTLYAPAFNEHYHSLHGAYLETQHVFIQHGLATLVQQHVNPIHVLEIGFGTGLNAICTLQHIYHTNTQVVYDTLEKYPVPSNIITTLNYQDFFETPVMAAHFLQMHEAAWNASVTITKNFTLQKIQTDLQTRVLTNNHYDVIYFDAFAPEKQPEMWTATVFDQMYKTLKPNSILVTYCAQGQFKRTLRQAGFRVAALPGPPGKREMTIGVKTL